MRPLALILSAALAATPAAAFARPRARHSAKKAPRPPPAPAPQGNPDLARAMQLYDQLDFEQALDALKKAATYPGSTRDEKVKIALYIGIVAAQLNDLHLADEGFTGALRADPTVKLPDDASPRIQQIFQAAKDRLYKPAPPPQLKALARALPGAADVTVEVTGATADMRAVTAWSRSVPAGGWIATDLKAAGAGRYAGRIVGPPETAEFYVEAADSEGMVIARAGSREMPLKEAVLPRPTPLVPPPAAPVAEASAPFYSTWWFWTVTGAVVLGAAGGVYYATRPGPQNCSPSPGGCLDVVIK